MEKAPVYQPVQPMVQAPISAPPTPTPMAEPHYYHIHMQYIHYHQQMLLAHLHHCCRVYKCCPICGNRPGYGWY